MTTDTPEMPNTPTTVATTSSRPGAAGVKDGLEKMRPTFQATLPSHISTAKFERIVMTAINTNPDLLSADRRSLWNACVRAAQDGLLPDGREGALVIFKDRTGKKLVTWMPMVYGLIKKMRQSGEIDSVGARVVFQKEIDDGRFSFIIKEGKEQLYHDPMLWGERGQKVLVYAYARFKDTGHVEYAPLHRDDVMKRRNASRTREGGIWSSWEDEMWLKTAIRAIAKRLPLSADILSTIERDEAPTEFDRLRDDAVRQLGAPPTPPTPGESVTQPVDTEDGESAQFAEEMIGRAIKSLNEPALGTAEALEEFADHIRERLSEVETGDDRKFKLLQEFNHAVSVRERAFESGHIGIKGE